MDLPIFVREAYGNDINKINLEKQVSDYHAIRVSYLGAKVGEVTDAVEVSL